MPGTRGKLVVRIIEAVSVNLDLDPWLSLEALSKASGLSVRSLRNYLSDPTRPLPHYRMREPHVIPTRSGRPRTVSGKILVKWSAFTRWMEAFKHTPDLDRLVDEVVSEIRG
jgi:hypothetical protein